MQIRNISTRTVYDFTLNSELVGGRKPIATLQPGEEAEIDIDMEAERLQVVVDQGVIEAEGLALATPA